MKYGPQSIAKCVFMLALLLGRPALANGPPPVITVQPQSLSVPLLGIASFSVTASSGTTMTYQWYRNGSAISGANSSSYSFLTILGSDSGVFRVKVTNAGGWVMSANAYLNIDPPPTITTQPQSQAVNQGGDVTFSVVASSSQSISYQWYFNGASLGTAASSSSYSRTNLIAGNAGSYTVVAANSTGSTTSQVATLTVIVPPGITRQPHDQTVTVGYSQNFKVTASGSAPLSYQWSFNGTPIASATTSVLSFNNTQTNAAGAYQVVITNAAGSITSAMVTLTVIIPPAITSQPQSQSVKVGQPSTFNVTATGTGPLAYQWSLNDIPLSGATGSSLSLTNIQPSDAGSYKVTVTNAATSITSSVAVMTVILPVTSANIVLATAANTPMTSNGFTFQLSVPVDSTYIIQASTDLNNWTPIATNVAGSGAVLFTDTDAPNYPTRYYRAMVLQ